MRDADSPFASPTSLGALADDLGHVVHEISCHQPFATVEHTPHGPSLLVGGVRVRFWMGERYDAEAETMAEEINAALAARMTGAPIP